MLGSDSALGENNRIKRFEFETWNMPAILAKNYVNLY